MQNPVLQLVTPPVEEPVSLAEAKAYLRVTGTSEDALISSLIMGARQWCEEITGRAFVTQTWDLWLDSLREGHPRGQEPWWDGTREGPISILSRPAREIRISKVPVIAVSEFVTIDDSDTETEFDLANLIVQNAAEPARLILKAGATWPVDLRAAAGVRIRFTAGYGDASAVPATIKQAIKLLVSHGFENREPIVTGTISSELAMTVKPYLQPYMAVRL